MSYLVRFYSLFALICLGLTPSLNAQNWQTPVEILDTIGGTGVTGHYNCMKIINGKPAIAFYDVTHTRLQYVYALDAQGNQWSEVITVDNSGSVGLNLSLEVVNGHPAIAYYDSYNGDLRYVRAIDPDGATWNAPIVIDSINNQGRFPSLAVVNGFPAISYHDATASDLRYVRASDVNGNAWNTPQTLFSVNAVASGGTSLAVVNGFPAIALSYSPAGTSTLRYMRATDANGDAWSTMVAVETGGTNPRLLVVDGQPAIAHFVSASTRVKYVRATDANGASWGASVFVSTSGETATYHAMALVGGFPTIAYYDQSNTRLKISTASNATGSTWSTAVVADAENSSGSFNWIVDLNGQPAVAYTQSIGGRLCFRKRISATNNQWEAAKRWNNGSALGEHVKLEIINGIPALCYYDQTNGKPKYVRATEIAGNTWNTPLVIGETTADIGKYCDLEVVDGRPSMVFYDSDNEYVLFSRANDDDGNSWPAGTSYIYSNTPTPAPEMQLMVPSTNPVVLFLSSDANRTYFKAASATDGSAWATNVFAPESTPNSGRFLSWARINGLVAFAHYDQTNANLRYVRSTNATATTWGTAVLVDEPGNVGQYTSLAEVNGFPAIAYYDVTNNKLKYVRATNAAGSTWGTPISVTLNGGGGKYAAMSIWNGKPIIVYQGGPKLKLYAIVANDADGTSWGNPVVIHDVPQTGLYNTIKVFNGEVFVATYCLQDARPYFIRGGVCGDPVIPENTSSKEALEVCAGTPTTLQVSGNDVQWFDAPNGGNVLASGGELSTGILNATSSFYASSRVCNVESERLEVSVNVTALPDASVSENGGTLTALPENASYQWIFCDGNNIENATLQEYLVEAEGNYAVVAVVAGCSDTSECVEVLITSIEDSEDSIKTQVFPNPAQTQMFIKWKELHHWALYDATGKLVQSGNEQVIHRENLSNGLYLLVMSGKDGSTSSKRIVWD
jgi:hypothetical protein